MLGSVMQTGKAQGMQTFSEELTRLAKKGIISTEDAYIKAIDKADIETKLQLAGLSLDFKKKGEESVRLARMAKPREMLKAALDTLENDRTNTEALCTAAWIMAASPFAELRNGRDALKMAEKACSLLKDKDARALEVLGVAQAENKSFRRAIDATRRAIAIYTQEGKEVKASALNSRLILFEKGQPYRDE